MARITVIDDDNDTLDLFREIFTEYGYETEVHSGAMPGIRYLVRSRPDAIVVDLQLDPHRQELTGLQLIHSVRSSRVLRDVPVIVCSADVQLLHDSWPELVGRGDIHMLEKPFDLATLDRLLELALGEAPPSLLPLGTLSAEDRAQEEEEA